MGFLDHSTNNIIVDAVLTDVGREKLANATTATNFIAQYAFADDEIDYTMIKKYGTVVGKEKIEKNTPVFEASTNAELGVKYYLSTSSNPIVAQPTLTTELSKSGLTTTVLETALTISLTDDNQVIDSIEYMVSYDYRFLTPTGNFQIKGKGNRRFIKVPARNKEDIVVRFRRGTAGQAVLAKLGKKKTPTGIGVVASTGLRKSISVIVDYT
tara:strand:+ start:1133 stop:1768 length:636 start_codon:yes stop_codon:yes gene_type:complete